MRKLKFQKHANIVLLSSMIVSLFVLSEPLFAYDMNNTQEIEGGLVGSFLIDTLYFIEDLFNSLGVLVVPMALFVFLGFSVIHYNKLMIKSQSGKEEFSDPRVEARIGRKVQEIDEEFCPEEFKQKAAECFIIVQKALSNREIEDIRSFETDELFNVHDEEVRKRINHHEINMIEKIKISKTELMDFNIIENKDILNIKVEVAMRDYIIDDQTKQLLDGDKNKDVNSTYRMEFIRTHGVKTQKGKEVSVTNCSNCGAPTTVTESGKCNYCGSLVTSGNYSWVLNELVKI